MVDLFRCSMSPEAGAAVARLYTPDASGRIYCGQGRYTDLFEQTLQETLDLPRVPLGVNSCSAAIDLALHMIGIGPGDEVISTSLTCTATNGPIVSRGAKVVWADIDPITGLIDPVSVAHLITPRTKAVIAVDWAGRACDYAALQAIAGSIPVIEDAAHRLYLPPIHGDYVAWSFGPIKHLTTGGYGGALLPPHAQHKRASLLRWHGLDRTLPNDSFRCEQDIEEVGYRYHMTDDQAVVGLHNLDLACRGVAQARDNARYYCQQLAGIEGITIPPFDEGCDYWLFGMIIEHDRDGFIARLAERGIASGRVHARNDKHTAFRASTACDTPIPGVDSFDSHQVNIPVGHWVTPSERDSIVEAVRASVLVPESAY